MKLKMFWITSSGMGTSLGNSYGVTAWSQDDALNILRSQIGLGFDDAFVIEIHSLNELDQNHVIPNMDEPVTRGVWYPLGFKPWPKSS